MSLESLNEIRNTLETWERDLRLNVDYAEHWFGVEAPDMDDAQVRSILTDGRRVYDQLEGYIDDASSWSEFAYDEAERLRDDMIASADAALEAAEAAYAAAEAIYTAAAAQAAAVFDELRSYHSRFATGMSAAQRARFILADAINEAELHQNATP